MIEQSNKNIPYYLTGFAIYIVLKFGYTKISVDGLIFLLKPVNKLLSLLIGSHSLYLSNKGYYFEELNILVDKSCSGFNFWLLSFLVFTYLFLKYICNSLYKVLVIPIVLLFTYLFTILVNTSRIYASIIVQSQTKTPFYNYQHLIHESMGIITNLFFLILSYYLIEKLLKRIHRYEKFA